MLSPTLATWRLVLHVLAATVWVGGQIVLAGIVPSLHRAHPEATKVVARAYARIAWPAFALAVLTGLWNLAQIGVSDRSTAYQLTLFVKLVLVGVSGTAAAVHQIGQTTAAKAIGGALGLLGALGAFFLGVLLLTGRS